MNTKNIRAHHEVIFQKLGIATENKQYELCVEEVIKLYVEACKDLELHTKDYFKQELLKIKTDRRN